MTSLQQNIMAGWPESKQDIAPNLEPFWCFQDELAVMGGLIMKGNRIIIPKSQQQETLKRLHDAH